MFSVVLFVKILVRLGHLLCQEPNLLGVDGSTLMIPSTLSFFCLVATMHNDVAVAFGVRSNDMLERGWKD